MPEATATDWAIVFAHGEPYDFEPGDEIVRAGDRERALYLLVDGTLGVRIPGAEDRLKRIDAPSLVGEVGFVDGGPRSATLEALTAGTIVRLEFAGVRAPGGRRAGTRPPDAARRSRACSRRGCGC